MAGIARQGYTKSKSGHMSQGLNPRVAEPRLIIICKLLTFIVFTGIPKQHSFWLIKTISLLVRAKNMIYVLIIITLLIFMFFIFLLFYSTFAFCSSYHNISIIDFYQSIRWSFFWNWQIHQLVECNNTFNHHVISFALTTKLIILINNYVVFRMPVKTLNVSKLRIISSLGSATLGFRPWLMYPLLDLV